MRDFFSTPFRDRIKMLNAHNKRPQVLGMIPARYSSSRFPGKMLAPILNKTLIQHSYENALKCTLFDHIVIATDHMEIFDHVISFGAHAIMTSPSCPTGTDRLAEAIASHPHLKEYPLVINIQGDEPCIDPRAMEGIIKILIDDPSAVMSTAVVPIRSEEEALDSSIVKCVFDKQGNALYFSRALLPSNHQGFYQSKILHYKHLGIYGFRQEFLMTYRQLPATPLQQAEDLEQLKVLEHGYRIKVAIVDDSSIGVNYPEDITKVEKLLCKQNTSLSQAGSVLL